MSFRLKTILGIALIQSVLLLILIMSGLDFLHDSNEEQLKLRAETTSRLFANAIKDAVLTTDLATLESFIEEIITNPDIRYARISSNNVVLAEGGDSNSLKLPHSPDKQLIDVTDSIYDVRVDIIEGGVTYGVIEMGLSTDNIELMLAKAKRWTVSIASLEVILVAILSFVLGTYLTRQLMRLKKAADTIALSGPGHQIKVTGHDEIASLADAFNIMSSSLEVSYAELSKSLETERTMATIANSNQAKNIAILSASLDAMITINEKGEVIDYNEVAALTFGWSHDEIIGKILADFIIPPNKRHAHHQGIEHYITSKTSPVINQRLELTAQHKLGHLFPIEITIAPIITDEATMFTAFIRDISERLEAESELRLAAKTFESSEAIFISNADGKIIRTNHAFTRITGYENSEVLGKNPRFFSSGKHDKSYYQEMWKVLAEQNEWSGEIYNKRKNGEIFPEYLNISAVKSKDGTVSHYIAHFMDISEQKHNEEKLLEAQHKAELANESKSRFLATMSHEIRTPMNAVLGILGLLKDTSLTTKQLDLVQIGRDSGELLLNIINDILDFTKMDIDKLQLEHSSFDLHQLITSSTDLLKHLAQRKSLGLILTLDPDLPKYAKGDADRIRQILVNLINNAIKFTTSGGINVTTCLESVSGEIMTLHCTVEDTGIGISAANQAALFDEFTMVDQTHSRKYEGTGLGLAICKRLVSLMHGSICVNSVLGNGSTFEFTIQLETANEKDAKDELVACETQLIPRANTRILLAEDNSANQMVIKSILEYANLKVDIVANGFEAIEAVNNIPYDIVLMDISMPEMDGMTATREIRKLSGEACNIPIIALTAHSLSGDRERFIESGMNDYLSKPIDREATLTCIARWTSNNDNDNVTENIANESPVDEANSLDMNYAYVDETVLQQLVRDTDAEIVPELLMLYIEDSEKRMSLINDAITNKDFETLEFETHTVGSSAAAHGNTKLYMAARQIEQLCLEGNTEQAIEQASGLSEMANESFRLLAKRASQGFEK